MMGRILDQLAMCRLPNEVVLPIEVDEQSRASTWTAGRVNTNMTSEIQEFEGKNERHVSNTLDEALRHLKLANDVPGKCLELENLLQQVVSFGVLKMPTLYKGIVFFLSVWRTGWFNFPIHPLVLSS